MKTLMISAAVLALATPAFAQVLAAPQAGGSYYASPEVTGSIRPYQAGPRDPVAERYSDNPAADGNATQMNKAVPNYGQTSEGSRAFYE